MNHRWTIDEPSMNHRWTIDEPSMNHRFPQSNINEHRWSFQSWRRLQDLLHLSLKRSQRQISIEDMRGLCKTLDMICRILMNIGDICILLYTFIYFYILLYTFIYFYILLYTFIYFYILLHTFIYFYILIYTYIYTYIYFYILMYTYIYLYILIYIHIYIYMPLWFGRVLNKSGDAAPKIWSSIFGRSFDSVQIHPEIVWKVKAAKYLMVSVFDPLI